MNPFTDKNEIKEQVENWPKPVLSVLDDDSNPKPSTQESQYDDGNLTVRSLSKRKFLAGGQWSQEENTEDNPTESPKANGHPYPYNYDGKTHNSSHVNCSKQCYTHNNNLVIEKSNLRCSDEKVCCFYVKFPLKVNNNVYPEKPLHLKDGMEDYFENFSSDSPSNVNNDGSTADLSPHKSHHNDYFQLENADLKDLSYPDQINALNGEEEDEDEGCIYTYKGDNYEANLSHLLQTCFSCGLPTTERSGGQNGAVSIQRILNGSPHPNPNPQSNLYSPEMDFLEMDFDPGSNGDGGDSDCEDNNSVLNVESKVEDNSLESFSQLQASGTKKTNNIPNEIRNLMCWRCEMCVYNERKKNNTLTNFTPKQNCQSNLISNLQSSPDDRVVSMKSYNNSSFNHQNLNVKVEASSDCKIHKSVSNLPSTSHSALEKLKQTKSVENDLNASDRGDISEDFSDGEEADDEGGDDSTSDLPPLDSGPLFIPSPNESQKSLPNSSKSFKTNKHLRFSSQNSYEKSCNSSKALHDAQTSSSSDASDQLTNCHGESNHMKDSNESNFGNNNLGSISAPEVSPSKEYSPLEKFSRSISFHNQLSSPKYENVCFSHPYKDNFLPSINKYISSTCNSYDCCSCKHGNSCKISQDSETTNLEACVDRLTQREKSVFNITSHSLSLDQESVSTYSYSNCLASNTAPLTTVNQDLKNEENIPIKNALGPIPLKILQPKVVEPFRDPNTVSDEDMQKEKQIEGERTQVEKVMIWTERQATFKQVSQVGTSACGPTAVINVLLSLDHSRPVKAVTSQIPARLRAEGAPLVEYLLSRSNAGTTHEDLIRGIEAISEGDVRGRFFHMFPKRAFQLSRWLTGWIKKGGVPVATLNLQVGVPPGQTVPDAWHHQMVFGVGPHGIYLTNPLECVSDSVLGDQLCSDSVLLVRRSDVVSRWDQKDKLVRLSLQSDPRWNEMNVLGQVVCILKEEAAPEMLQGRRHLTSHVAIPASYQSGFSIFVRADNPCLAELEAAPDLPLLDE